MMTFSYFSAFYIHHGFLCLTYPWSKFWDKSSRFLNSINSCLIFWTLKVRNAFVALGYAKDSVLHGFCQNFDANKQLIFVGMMRNGVPFGTCWKLLRGGHFYLIYLYLGRCIANSEAYCVATRIYFLGYWVGTGFSRLKYTVQYTKKWSLFKVCKHPIIHI